MEELFPAETETWQCEGGWPIRAEFSGHCPEKQIEQLRFVLSMEE